MNRRRFLWLLWSTLGVYEVNCLFLAWIMRAHPPSFFPSLLSRGLEGTFLLATLLPVYLFLSFRGYFPKRPFVNLLFFLLYFSSGVFLTGLLVVEGGISLHQQFDSPGPVVAAMDRWTFGEGGGGLFLLTLFGIALFERIRPPRVHRKTLHFPDLPPDLSGTTILHLSDLHVGAWQGEEALRRIAGLAEGLGPDLLVYTGDLIDHREEEVEIFEKIFGGVRGRLGTFAVLGNHEYWTLGGQARDVMVDHGVPVLKNESRAVRKGEGTLRVVGIDDPAGEDACDGCGPNLKEGFRGGDPSDFILVLVHQPPLWEGEIKEKAHLTLSGHTHGGQIGGARPFWNLARIFFQYDAGWFQAPSKRGRFLHVSTGLGYFGIPIRLGMTPEMTLITLASSNPTAPPESFDQNHLSV